MNVGININIKEKFHKLTIDFKCYFLLIQLNKYNLIEDYYIKLYNKEYQKNFEINRQKNTKTLEYHKRTIEELKGKLNESDN